VVALPAVGFAFWDLVRWWMRSASCPLGDDGRRLRLDQGGWGEPTWCVTPAGSNRPAIHRELAWFDPWPLTVVLALGSLAVVAGAAIAVRHLWAAPTTATLVTRGTARRLWRGVTVLYAWALGAGALVLAVIVLVLVVAGLEVTGYLVLGLPLLAVAASAALTAALLLRPTGPPPTPEG
jgi:hypothetical protein